MRVFRPTGPDTYLKAATIITHTDPKAYWGALAVALATHENFASRLLVDAKNYYNRLELLLGPEMAGDYIK
jgi:ADP-ribosylglycohydrolase